MSVHCSFSAMATFNNFTKPYLLFMDKEICPQNNVDMYIYSFHNYYLFNRSRYTWLLMYSWLVFIFGFHLTFVFWYINNLSFLNACLWNTHILSIILKSSKPAHIIIACIYDYISISVSLALSLLIQRIRDNLGGNCALCAKSMKLCTVVVNIVRVILKIWGILDSVCVCHGNHSKLADIYNSLLDTKIAKIFANL